VHHFDMYATAAAAAGAEMPDDRKMDGADLLPFATGEAVGVPHEALFWRSGAQSDFGPDQHRQGPDAARRARRRVHLLVELILLWQETTMSAGTTSSLSSAICCSIRFWLRQ
jgi:arylsulfatase A-like enzyme